MLCSYMGGQVVEWAMHMLPLEKWSTPLEIASPPPPPVPYNPSELREPRLDADREPLLPVDSEPRLEVEETDKVLVDKLK